ncbi:FliG C-terminal domain-containing protein [Sulfurimonas sp. HSL3-7]|uniref:FliG C-terminal domain-containing protein n=1 Tax=Sulfonitrofixus jiaomeiensis TaxID=3131938 RepID=UPI0031F780E9
MALTLSAWFFFRHRDKKELIFAEQGAAQELQEKFFDSMSSKAYGGFREKMASAHFPKQTKRRNAIKKYYLLAEQPGDDDRIHVIKT